MEYQGDPSEIVHSCFTYLCINLAAHGLINVGIVLAILNMLIFVYQICLC